MKSSKTVQTALAVLLYIGLGLFIISRVADVLDFSVLIASRYRLLKGAGLTIGLSLMSVISSMAAGFIIFLMTESKNHFTVTVSRIYREIIMGTPLLVLVFVVIYIIGVAFGIRNKMLLGFLSLTLYMSPYMANIFDGAYKSIDASQFIVMDFYGFSLAQRYRYIILPQMVRPVIPGLINNLSGIIKGTSILSTIAVSEIFYTTQVLSNQTYRYIGGYFLLWLTYLAITIPLSGLAKKLEEL